MELFYLFCLFIFKVNGFVDFIFFLIEDRKYKYFILFNGFEVVVVSDFKVDKVVVSMDVGVGYLSDLDDLFGCVYFW